MNNVFLGRCVNNVFLGRCVNNVFLGRCVNNVFLGRCVNNVFLLSVTPTHCLMGCLKIVRYESLFRTLYSEHC